MNLHALEFQTQRDGQRMRQRGLADAGHILDQQVTVGQQAGERQLQGVGFAEHDLAELIEDAAGEAGLAFLMPEAMSVMELFCVSWT